MGFMIRAAAWAGATFLIATIVLPASALADDDPIAALIRQVRADQPALAPPPAPTPADKLAQTYEDMARNLIRAAIVHRPTMLSLPPDRLANALRGMLIQAGFETGRFKSQLAVEACNYWGMKDRDDIVAGRIFYKNEYYESFRTMFEGCAGYMQALNRKRYTEFESHTGSPQAYLAYLAKSGWCPDRTYVSDAMGLYRSDKEAIEDAVRVALGEWMMLVNR